MDGVRQLQVAVLKYRGDVEAYKQYGDIYARVQGDLILFNYTPLCPINNRWNEIERVSRGVIFNWETGAVVARPFPKFFNLNEREETFVESLPFNEGFEVTEKLDGSLGIAYIAGDGTCRIATRGSFESPQALWATTFLNEHYPRLVDRVKWLTYIEDHYPLSPYSAGTLLFEIICPENEGKLVVPYTKEQYGLYLIGVNPRYGGTDNTHAELTYYQEKFNLPVVPSYPITSVDELIALSKEKKGIEGWVVRFNDGRRVKIKTLDYLEKHRITNRFSFETVKEAMLNGTFDDYVANLPPDYVSRARKYKSDIYDVWQHIVECMEMSAAPLIDRIERGVDDRKWFAETVNKMPKKYRKFYFLLLDGKDIKQQVLKSIEQTDIME